jgi:hypothetical protein
MSPFQLKDSYYSYLNLDFDPEKTQEPDQEGYLDFYVAIKPTLKVLRSKEHSQMFRAELTLETDVDHHTHPISLNLRLVGLFELDETQIDSKSPDESEAKAFMQIKLNGGAMLYSACREYVRIVASRFPFGQDFQLPTISPREAFSSQE